MDSQSLVSAIFPLSEYGLVFIGNLICKSYDKANKIVNL
jgi:hypothetical protein